MTPFSQLSLGEKIYNIGILLLGMQLVVRLIWAAWQSRRVKYRMHCCLCKQTHELTYWQFAKMKATHFGIHTPWYVSISNAHCPHCNAKRELVLQNLYQVAPGLKIMGQTFVMGLLLLAVRFLADKWV